MPFLFLQVARGGGGEAGQEYRCSPRARDYRREHLGPKHGLCCFDEGKTGAVEYLGMMERVKECQGDPFHAMIPD